MLDHAWQSTAVLALAALAAWMMRRHSAQARYWVWMAASIKFLLPFSVLISLGEKFAWRTAPAAGAGFAFAMEQAARPFSPTVPPLTHPDALPTGTLLTAIWLAGCAAVLLRWTVRWMRIRAAMGAAEIVRTGREAAILRRVTRRSIPLLRSQSMLEPGVFGIFRPVLMLPAGIADRLSDAQLEAIFAHEAAHIRRHDNLAAALHMAVEAVFWFYPPAWWLGARLVEERERACDEDVLRRGGAREAYAEGVLEVCRFCLESPLACAAGITGADLNRRIHHIMLGKPGDPPTRARKLLLAAAGAATLALPFAAGSLAVRPAGAQPQAQGKNTGDFEAASIKPASPGARGWGLVVDPGRLRILNLTVQQMVGEAYGMADFRISAPNGLPPGRYDIVATAPGHQSREFDRPLQVMLQRLLAERFHLETHREEKVLSHYELVTARGGVKLKPSDQPGYSTRSGAGFLNAWGLSLNDLAAFLTRRLDRPVVDGTGIPGRFDLTLQWSPDETQSNPEMPNPNQAPAAADETRPSIFRAMEEQLGLKLEGRRSPVEILVIDRATTPAEN